MNAYVLPISVVIFWVVSMYLIRRKPPISRTSMVVYVLASSLVYGYLASLHKYDFGYGTDLNYMICSIVGLVGATFVFLKLPSHK